MLDALSDHVFLIEQLDDGSFRIAYSNQAMARFMGRSVAELTGLRLDALLGDEALHARIAACYRQALSSGEVLHYEESTEGFAAQPARVFDTRIAPLRDAKGRLRYICGVSRDISERIHAEQALRDKHAQLQDTLAQLSVLQRQLQQEVVHDPLTGLYNRRHFEAALRREVLRAAREGSALSLLMLDLDHFKRFNDDYGHVVGDRVLVAFAQWLRQHMRGEDVLSRWGGEEFLLLLPRTRGEQARQRAEAWRAQLRDLDLRQAEARLVIEFSAGIAECPQHADTPETLLQAADRALYRAKALGRNRVCLSSD
jgi:diguanylate cyclase (GGDEF)-like protein/PAS domain S-box-containing protein